MSGPGLIRQLLVALGLITIPPVPVPTPFYPVQLADPQDWIPGPSIFTKNVIFLYSAPMEEHTAVSWEQLIRSYCLSNPDCTTVATFARNRTTLPDDNDTLSGFRFGWIFRGLPATPDDFSRDKGVMDSKAFTTFCITGTDCSNSVL